MKRLWIGLAIVSFVAACTPAALPSPSPSAETNASPEPTELDMVATSPTVIPSLDPEPRGGRPEWAFEPVPIPPLTSPPPTRGDLPIQGRREENGVLVTIRLERNPMPAGEPTWLFASVENRGPDNVIWWHDGCATPVWAGGPLDARWREGLSMSGDAALFKRYALGLGFEAGPVPLRVRFTPVQYIGQGQVGCADLGIADEIEPGQILESRLRWNGLVGPELGLPPSGPVELIGTFGYFWRASQGQPDDIPERRIEVELDAWIDPGKPSDQLDPPEIIDVALTDKTFATWFATKQFANGVEDYVRYLPEPVLWHVGVIEWNTPGIPQLTYLVIDPITGSILDRVQRPWDFKTDHKP